MRLNLRLTAALVLAVAMASATTAAANTTTNRAVVRPNPDEQTLTAHTTHVAVPVAPSPTIQPNPDEQPAITAAQSTVPHSEVIDNGGYGFSNTPATIVRVTTPGGFDWGDAGIGAAGGIALSMIGVAAVLALSQRRTRATTGSADAMP
jgi:hypothetical protein